MAARLAAVLALAACGVAIYFLVSSFTESESAKESKNDKKGRSEQAKDQKAFAVLEVDGVPTPA